MPGQRVQFELIAGFGNPGSEYAATRHNAGFWYVDELARQLGASFNTDKRFFAAVATAQFEGRKIILVKPMNFMNNSGQGLGAVARFYKIEPGKILVAHDELDLSPGHIRLKNGGGHGGHNGLRDSLAKLGSSDFWRMRIGIGHPGHKSAVSGYVLKRAPADQQRLMDEAIELALRESPTIIDGDINVATKALHSHKPPTT
ncbi:aminoacyl-tRNA hydrolase [Granulosicoccus antarcticus]|uniref:Peptidyl-tRNA hydrolase n=1 Tax=Granulosicoccus antarcticus IMCC3135 TaxID=1192854 RepID=A0A2Z2NNX6_9GAMM|nr:aminoacyl-tRNA hydrolase [Granulosicoccus antarcticus]ASJ72235.1 Peptidyl-tRNA hydrolase [Granulosicoccus antarcticus IMCC3135]